MSVSAQIIERARGLGGGRVVFPEGEDARVQEAAQRLAALELCEPVLLKGDEQPVSDAYIERFQQQRPNSKPAAIAKRLRRAVYNAAMQVAVGDARAVVAGCVLPTKAVVEAARLCIGLGAGVTHPSSCFVMHSQSWSEPLVFADCAVNVAPDSEALASIAIASAESARKLLGVEPRVALLSFSTHGSGSHASIDVIHQALALVRQRQPTLAVDGELQADTALSRLVAQRKVQQPSDVAGQANVLVFPDLNSGNIAYKLVQQLAGAQALGPLLQGFAAPVADLSRGASVDEIVNTTAATLCQAVADT